MAARHDLYLCEINGGNLRNAIPREAYAICAVPEDAKHDVRTELNIFTSEMEDELSVVEPDLKAGSRIGNSTQNGYRPGYYYPFIKRLCMQLLTVYMP